MAEDAQTGVVVVALPTAGDAVHTIGPEQKHATLLYFGDVDGGENPNATEGFASYRSLIESVCRIVAAEHGPFTEQVTEVAPLGDSGAHVWMLAGDRLPSLREDLLEVDLELVGVLEGVEQFPSYTPHVTVGYEAGGATKGDLADPDADPDVTGTDLEAAGQVEFITFDRLALWWAGDQIEFPLTGTPVTEGAVMTKTIHEATGVIEKATSTKSGAVRRNIQIITPGWGSSGYYSAEVLERAAKNRVIPKGTHMYLNHASESERKDRPEREVEKIAAVLVEDAVWDGARLLAPADLMGPHAELIEAVAPYTGVSISGSATDIVLGEAEGRRGPIIEDLARVDSVDFVTHAGRGGMVLLESARPSLVNALAVEHGIAEATANETRELLAQALREKFPGEKVWVWVRDFDDETVWYEHETTAECGTYSLGYLLSDDGVITFSGDPIEVRAETNYVPATRPDSTTTESLKEDSMPKKEIEEAEYTRLVEAAGRVETLESEFATEKAAREAAEARLAEADKNPPTPRNPREVMETQMREQGRQIALLRAGQQARGIVAEVLSGGWIGEAQVARLSNELTQESALPLTDEGALDEAKLRATALARLDEAETEAAEILASAGVGTVKGLGSSARATEVAIHQYDTDLGESMGVFGLSESAVETAVKGR